MEPSPVAVLAVNEHRWSVPLVRAEREAGGETIASARLPAADVISALDEVDAKS